MPPEGDGRPTDPRGTDPHPGNVPGAWFVDERCIDCDAVRQIAPDLFDRVDRQSVVSRQPDTPEDEERMWRAALACPTNSVRRSPPLPRPRDLYPHEFAGDVWYCGHNSPDSYGANAFLAVRPEGNVLVDSPRFVRPLVERIEAMGGIDHVLLTHRDDVADADRFAERFGARVWIHREDADAAPFATDVVDGQDPVVVQPGLQLIPCAGHTRGSVLFLLDDRFLFTGDSLYWSRTHQDLAVHVRQTWYSLEVQRDSLARVAREHRFSAVLAGHGSRHETTVDDMHRRLVALVDRLGAP
ncbi:MAG: MBL fold metallo-hydrolase [Actinobacteria bacterium]|nr:MBL fold metallo-hydrolase [Actinomycetota bacterium]